MPTGWAVQGQPQDSGCRDLGLRAVGTERCFTCHEGGKCLQETAAGLFALKSTVGVTVLSRSLSFQNGCLQQCRFSAKRKIGVCGENEDGGWKSEDLEVLLWVGSDRCMPCAPPQGPGNLQAVRTLSKRYSLRFLELVAAAAGVDLYY